MDNGEPIKPTCNNYIEAETVSEGSDMSSFSNVTDVESEKSKIISNEILVIEPFYSGSHRIFIDTMNLYLRDKVSYQKICLFTMPGKKWHWRARTSALYFSRVIPRKDSYKVLFCSSVLNLAELIALRLDLSKLFKVIYFHENQLVYPVRKYKDRDFQYGYNQILSCLVADLVVFNSHYNMNSLLENIDGFLKLQPDFRVKNLKDEIYPKCKVVYFPVQVPSFDNVKGDILHIIWPHRWEHDKNPHMFFEILFRLKDNKLPFRVSILGEAYEDVPDVFHKAKEILSNEIIQFGRLESKNEYFRFLRTGHVAVSTAAHEFFGVAMLEAVLSGCFPLACNNLVYPELYPSECLYNTPNQLYKKLKNLCEKPYLAEIYLKKADINYEKFKVEVVMKNLTDLILKTNK